MSNAIVRAALTVTSTAPGSPHSIGLVEKGPGGFPPPEPEPGPAGTLHFRPDVTTFGSILTGRGSLATRTLTIENQTGATVSISFPASPSGSAFQLPAFSGTLAHGAQRSFRLIFRGRQQRHRPGDPDRDKYRRWKPALDRTHREGTRRVSNACRSGQGTEKRGQTQLTVAMPNEALETGAATNAAPLS